MFISAGAGGGTYSIDDVAATLDTINVDPETIDAIVQILNLSADQIGDRTFEDLPVTTFGSSPAGGQLGHHTHLAHQTLTQAMAEMMDELARTSQDVVAYQRTQQYNDDMARQRFEQFISMVFPWAGPR